MRHALLPALAVILLIAGCATPPVLGSRSTVTGVGPDDFLRLRAGPGLGFRVLVGLPDGTEVVRRDCVTEAFQLWCRVSPAAAPGLTGYVSADYLTSD
ncbi:SH3 domain-containing protein [Roseivivax lentus]|uniref:SH3 domain-containing protein n=1 Tax=Roseivivax lentus TaxID=633194 RepID=A0A1N7PPU9_9RHOB|nr:SH3 domain-containing protein [Roseivivax lentus]SIT12507.1 SH3 domain-containing protein [Roseivivax lentus]